MTGFLPHYKSYALMTTDPWSPGPGLVGMVDRVQQNPGTMSFWAYIIQSCKNSLRSNFLTYDPIRSQICTCHDSWAVVACAKFCYLIKSSSLPVRVTCVFLQDLNFELIKFSWNRPLLYWQMEETYAILNLQMIQFILLSQCLSSLFLRKLIILPYIKITVLV